MTNIVTNERTDKYVSIIIYVVSFNCGLNFINGYEKHSLASYSTSLFIKLTVIGFIGT